MDYILMVWLIFHSWLSEAHQERHHVYYRFTVLTKAGLSPPFSAVGVYDDKQFIHYYNNLIRVNLTEYDGIVLLPEPGESRVWYKDLLKTLSNCTNSQCSDHVLQRIIGCKLEKLPDGTVKNLTVFDEYGFDGEDFISFNSDTMKWIDKSPKAKETKEEWDLQTDRNKFIKNYLEKCVHTISTYNNTNMSSPDVHVFVRKSPDDDSNLVLMCLATGFYPRDVQMNIRLNRTKLEDQTSSGIRPNDDETFQMRISVKIDRNDKGSYDCLLIHSSLTEPVSVEWDGKCSNCESDRRRDVGAVAVVLLLAVIVIVIYFISRRRRPNSVMTWRCSYGSTDDQTEDDLFRL